MRENHGRKRISFCGYCVAAAVLFSSLPPLYAATNADLSLTIGAEYTTGDYGTSSKTEVWYFPVTFKYANEINVFALTVPFVSVEGTGNVVLGGGGEHAVPHATTSATRRTESGLGDVIVMASHKLTGTATSRIDLTGKIKLATADDTDNLGTGENDYAIQLDFEGGYNSNGVYGSAGYKVLGDPPGIDYKNVLYGTLGFSHKLDAARSAGAEVYAQEAATSSGKAPTELTLYLSNRTDRKTKLTGYLLMGLSDGSPDWGVGVSLKLSQ